MRISFCSKTLSLRHETITIYKTTTKLETVTHKHMKTREDAVIAIRRLLDDLAANPTEWENPTLEHYLESMAAWLESYGNKHHPSPSWDFIIQMLEAAKIYE